MNSSFLELITNLTNLVDLAMNDLCYEKYQAAVYLNSFDCVFVHKEVRDLV